MTHSISFAGRRAATALLLAGTFATAATAVLAAPALPDYQPGAPLTGVLRSNGNIQMEGLMKAWEKDFARYHPKLQFEDKLKGTTSGIYGIEMRTAELAVMGRAMHPFERYGTYERAWVYPIEIEVATGSDTKLKHSPAFAILVHKDNPIAKLTVRQLDGVFGAQRLGGWEALSWMLENARGKDKNIRTWGQLGVGGALASQPIHVYSPPLEGAGTVSFFSHKVLQGGQMWNEDLREYADRKKLVDDLSRDPNGIAYVPLAYATGGVKPIALADTDAGPFVKLTKASVADRSYPLSRPVYLTYTIDDPKNEISETRGDPKVREFLRYVLSRQGQAVVAREGSYLPLPAAVVAKQIEKMEFKGVPPEKKLLHDE